MVDEWDHLRTPRGIYRRTHKIALPVERPSDTVNLIYKQNEEEEKEEEERGEKEEEEEVTQFYFLATRYSSYELSMFFIHCMRLNMIWFKTKDFDQANQNPSNAFAFLPKKK